jgi:hypothetical protein
MRRLWVISSSTCKARFPFNGIVDFNQYFCIIIYSTEAPNLGQRNISKPHFTWPNPTDSPFIKDVNANLLSPEEMKKTLEVLTSFTTRYYNSDSGKASSEWLYRKILDYTNELLKEEVGHLIDVDVRVFGHRWKQSSIVSEAVGFVLFYKFHLRSSGVDRPYGTERLYPVGPDNDHWGSSRLYQ